MKRSLKVYSRPSGPVVDEAMVDEASATNMLVKTSLHFIVEEPDRPTRLIGRTATRNAFTPAKLTKDVGALLSPSTFLPWLV